MKRKSNDTTETLQRKAAELSAALKERGLDERAAELAERVRDSDALATASAKGAQVAERVRDSDALATASAKGAQVAERVRDSDALATASAKGAELAAATTAKAAILAALTRERLREAGFDEKATEAAGRVGDWLTEGRTGDLLAVQPRKRSKGWLLGLIGIAVGYAIAVATASKRGSDSGSDLIERMTSSSSSTSTASSSPSTTQGSTEPGTGTPPAQGLLEDRIRTALGSDPRTSSLPRLNVNVVEGTVFVRGSVPAGFEEEDLRAVVAGVEGVTDVDLQVSASTGS